MNIPVTGETEDTAAIRSVIWEETAAFADKDFDRWAACYVHNERTHEVYMTDRGVIVHRGWDEVAGAMRRLMTDNPEPITEGFSQQDHRISLDNNLAWVTFHSECRVLDSRIIRAPDNFETRILEREKGQWKIIYAGVAFLREQNSSTPVVQIDPDGKVVWATNETLAAVKTFEGLTISAGRLRASQRKWDTTLQDTIARAAKLRHLFESTFTTEVGNQFVYPCILGDSDEGGVLHCLVFVRNGSVNVSFKDRAFIDRKIEAAAEVFGLSGGQKRLAREVAEGFGLTDAAHSLGISINTARTHLTRVYEKTGVNSQSALVRLVMSVNSMA